MKTILRSSEEKDFLQISLCLAKNKISISFGTFSFEIRNHEFFENIYQNILRSEKTIEKKLFRLFSKKSENEQETIYYELRRMVGKQVSLLEGFEVGCGQMIAFFLLSEKSILPSSYSISLPSTVESGNLFCANCFRALSFASLCLEENSFWCLCEAFFELFKFL